MRLFMMALVATAFAVLAAMPVRADLAEDGGSGSATRSQPAAVDPKNPPEVISNYQQPKAAPATSVKPVKSEPIQLLPAHGQPPSKSKLKKRRKKRISKKRTRRNKASVSASSEAWWDQTGNGLVADFRDCISSYASTRGLTSSPYGSKLLISSAMDSDCREQFDAMAGAISERFGKEKFAELAPQLIDQVLVPAVTNRTQAQPTSASGG
jgi:hypothetical protein